MIIFNVPRVFLVHPVVSYLFAVKRVESYCIIYQSLQNTLLLMDVRAFNTYHHVYNRVSIYTSSGYFRGISCPTFLPWIRHSHARFWQVQPGRSTIVQKQNKGIKTKVPGIAYGQERAGATCIEGV